VVIDDPSVSRFDALQDVKPDHRRLTFIGQLKKDRRRVTGRKDTRAFILREGRAVALLQSLPSEPVWLTAFVTVDLAYFQRSLAALRCADQRSQAWQARRDLKIYLTHLEQGWETSD